MSPRTTSGTLPGTGHKARSGSSQRGIPPGRRATGRDSPTQRTSQVARRHHGGVRRTREASSVAALAGWPLRWVVDLGARAIELDTVAPHGRLIRSQHRFAPTPQEHSLNGNAEAVSLEGKQVVDVALAETAPIGGNVERRAVLRNLGDLDELCLQLSLPRRHAHTTPASEVDVTRCALLSPIADANSKAGDGLEKFERRMRLVRDHIAKRRQRNPAVRVPTRFDKQGPNGRWNPNRHTVASIHVLLNPFTESDANRSPSTQQNSKGLSLISNRDQPVSLFRRRCSRTNNHDTSTRQKAPPVIEYKHRKDDARQSKQECDRLGPNAKCLPIYRIARPQCNRDLHENAQPHGDDQKPPTGRRQVSWSQIEHAGARSGCCDHASARLAKHDGVAARREATLPRTGLE